MRSRRHQTRIHQGQGGHHVQYKDATHNLCPWCNEPYVRKLPIICHHGVDWAYGHVTGENVMTMHFDLTMTGGEDPDVMEISEGHDYMYQTGQWDYHDVFEGGEDEC